MGTAALDIGGTAIKSGIWTGIKDEIKEVRETPTNARLGGAHVVEQAVKILESYHGFDAIGISTAGQVDSQRGMIRYANENIPGYTGMEIGRMLRERFHVPVAVENDVNVAALGEGIFGAGRGERDFLCLTYGTGVGGAIVMDQKVYHGCAFSAGEFGGLLIHPEDRKEGEFFSGCYEKYASATALAARAMVIDPALTDGRKIFAAIDQPGVQAAVDEWIDEIVNGLQTLIHIFNPSCVILGGGVMAQPYVTEQVRVRTMERIMPSFRDVNILPAELGNRAGLLGAAWLGREEKRKENGKLQ